MLENQEGFVLNFAPTGIVPTKEMTPHVPICGDEIVEQVLEAAQLGANMVHLHARDPKTGSPTHCAEVYAELVSRIRSHEPELVICVSTSGRTGASPRQRAEVLDLDGAAKPDCASLTLGSLNFAWEASINSPPTVKFLAERMLARGIKPELEVFDLGMLNYLRYLKRKDLLRPPYYVNFLLGNVAGAQADPPDLGALLSGLPEQSVWACGGIGGMQVRANALALAAGGGARVGLEDSIWFDSARTRLATNRTLIKRVLALGELLGRQPYRKQETRMLLGISTGEAVRGQA